MQNSMILQFISEHPWYSLFYTIGTYLFFVASTRHLSKKTRNQT
ncbi:hypothetical protein LEP1GSC067_2245 [Leptospira interrogans serovar Lora str. TE 1992]|uniref:Uncharacterized protein n=1 Tax=Leptospira interrogans serovar Lora str. TE 1992 TaxID=1193028 RepID=M3E1C5_LEPIR|nr:hypothetical protein LEP1GSC067_2245 [Leptospira interrogans serovar Lora str. TE 1992]